MSWNIICLIYLLVYGRQDIDIHPWCMYYGMYMRFSKASPLSSVFHFLLVFRSVVFRWTIIGVGCFVFLSRFNYPADVSLGTNGTLFVADLHSLRRISLPENPTTVLGVGFDGTVATAAGGAGVGEEDGTGPEVQNRTSVVFVLHLQICSLFFCRNDYRGRFVGRLGCSFGLVWFGGVYEIEGRVTQPAGVQGPYLLRFSLPAIIGFRSPRRKGVCKGFISRFLLCSAGASSQDSQPLPRPLALPKPVSFPLPLTCFLSSVQCMCCLLPTVSTNNVQGPIFETVGRNVHGRRRRVRLGCGFLPPPAGSADGLLRCRLGHLQHHSHGGPAAVGVLVLRPPPWRGRFDRIPALRKRMVQLLAQRFRIRRQWWG